MMNPIEASGKLYSAKMGYGVPTTTEGLLPLYNSLVNNQKGVGTTMDSESSLTYKNVPLLPKKRSRDSINPIPSFSSPVQQQQSHRNTNNKACSSLLFLGHDISVHMEQQQLGIDRFENNDNKK
ncbi:hypothetical protein V6N13_127491 [Hibiscus sabdariffa]|uniref:Uncharacterized protein n=1 Tax=Hibiscus sabdariffa TaxID=183260 RepID=A0ABR2RCA1_9ROSI